MSEPCAVCKGRGEVDRLVFRGRKPCWNCDGTGTQAGMDGMWPELKQGVRDAADEWMDRIDPDHDWGPEFEEGGWVPAEGAERWAHGPGGEDWDP